MNQAADQLGRPYARGGVIGSPGARPVPVEQALMPGEHITWSDGRIERRDGDRMVPCGGECGDAVQHSKALFVSKVMRGEIDIRGPLNLDAVTSEL